MVWGQMVVRALIERTHTCMWQVIHYFHYSLHPLGDVYRFACRIVQNGFLCIFYALRSLIDSIALQDAAHLFNASTFEKQIYLKLWLRADGPQKPFTLVNISRTRSPRG